jgi:hypothetical protein
MDLSEIPRIRGPLKYVGYIGVLIMISGLLAFGLGLVSMFANFDPENPPDFPPYGLYGFGVGIAGSVLVTIALALGPRESEFNIRIRDGRDTHVSGDVIYGDVIGELKGNVIIRPTGRNDARYYDINQQRTYVGKIEVAVRSLPLRPSTRQSADAAVEDVGLAVERQDKHEIANALVRLTTILNEAGVLASSTDAASRAIVGLAQTLGGYAQSLVNWFGGFVDQVAPAATKPGQAAVDENVQFTVYRPRTIRPTLWYPLVAFAHLSQRRTDAPGDPDPIQEVDRQARQTLGEQFTGYAQLTEDFLSAIPREGELTLIPTATGITFNPPSRSFIWTESVHREEFRLQADPGTAGTTVRGRLSVFSGVLLVADVGLSFRVVPDAIPDAPIDQGVDHLRHYRKIFASYSHKDIEIAQLLERYASLFGDRYVRDWVDLRAGQRWRDELKQMIRDADIFQLLWSSNAMRSDYVRQEYEYALSLGRPEFVRPTYWEHPLPSDPAVGLPPEELRALHFQRFAVSSLGGTEADRATEVAPDVPAPADAPRPPAELDTPAVGPVPLPDATGATVDAHVESRGITCAVCGTKNDASNVFCMNCGAFLEFQAAPPEAAEMASTPAARRPADVPETARRYSPSRRVDVRVAEPGDYICANCGEPNDSTRRFCWRCGNDLHPSPAPAPAPAPAPEGGFGATPLLPLLLFIGLVLLGILGTVAFFSQPPT